MMMIGDKVEMVGKLLPTKIIEADGTVTFEIADGIVTIDARSTDLKTDMQTKYGIPV